MADLERERRFLHFPEWQSVSGPWDHGSREHMDGAMWNLLSASKAALEPGLGKRGTSRQALFYPWECSSRTWPRIVNTATERFPKEAVQADVIISAQRLCRVANIFGRSSCLAPSLLLQDRPPLLSSDCRCAVSALSIKCRLKELPLCLLFLRALQEHEQGFIVALEVRKKKRMNYPKTF